MTLHERLSMKAAELSEAAAASRKRFTQLDAVLTAGRLNDRAARLFRTAESWTD